jgi:predicted metal-dependent RNase
MRMYDDPANLLCIIGWQPPGSLGGRLLAGESPVLVGRQEGKKFKQDWISPAIATRKFHSFSGHADAAGLVEWLGAATGVQGVFLVHGEEKQALALEQTIRAKLGLEVIVPRRGGGFVLTARRGAVAKSFPAPAAGRSDSLVPAVNRSDSLTRREAAAPSGDAYEGAD